MSVTLESCPKFLQFLANWLLPPDFNLLQICSASGRYVGGSSMFLGFVNSCKADIGIHISEYSKLADDSFHLIFSMNFLRKLMKQTSKLQFQAMPETNSHVEKVDKEWIDIVPLSPNSYEFRSSIYSCLNSFSLDKVCVMEITE